MIAEIYNQGPRNVSKHCMTAEEYKTSITEREKNRLNGFMRTGNPNVENHKSRIALHQLLTGF